MFRIKTINILLITTFLILSCNFADNEKKPKNPSRNKDTFDKAEVIPAAFEETWVITAIEENMNYFGFNGKSLNEIEDKYVEAIFNDIMSQIYQRMQGFELIRQEKYAEITNNLTIENIVEGDILITVSRNASLMAIDNEDTVHHALLCIKAPLDKNDEAFITSSAKSDSEMPYVQYYSMEELNSTEDVIIVLRLLENNKSVIENAITYAKNQTNKPYNSNFIDKMNNDAFYCSQLVWRAFYEAGVNLDYNHNEYNDYNLVLASDIYKSDLLYIVKYSD